MQNPWAWLVSRFAQKAVPIACGTPHVWAEEQQLAAEQADQAQSYDGKIYTGDEATRVMATWRDGERKQ